MKILRYAQDDIEEMRISFAMKILRRFAPQNDKGQKPQNDKVKVPQNDTKSGKSLRSFAGVCNLVGSIRKESLHRHWRPTFAYEGYIQME